MTQTDSVNTGPAAAVEEPESAAERSVLSTSPVAQAGLGVVAAAFGVIALIDASGLDMFGKKGVPGPGFFPISLSVAIIGLGLLLTVVSVLRGLRHGRGPADQMHGLRAELLRAAGVWLGFLIGVALMPLIGFVPANIVLIAYLVFGVERIRGIKAVLVIIAVPLVAYALFVFVLGVELPTSILFEGP
jgi:tripartite tricarboxylate transporter TctB family protein